MQAIETKFLAPTNTQGARYKATAAAGSITIHADYALAYDGNHLAAANALVEKLGWNLSEGYPPIVGGCLPNGNYASVFVKVS